MDSAIYMALFIIACFIIAFYIVLCSSEYHAQHAKIGPGQCFVIQ